MGIRSREEPMEKMASNYVGNNAPPPPDHEVHIAGCVWMPADRTYLGEHNDCFDAIRVARKTYRQANGCYFCCNACHSQ